MARICVFCRGPANSREHAFPDWLSKIVPGEGLLKHTRESGATSWEAGGFDHRVRQVCATCNQTWMSDLEKASKGLVTDLVLDRRTAPLAASEQIALARWLYKTGTMLALAYPESDRYVLPEDYRYFFEHRKPPDGTTIWIAALVFDTPEHVQVGWTKPERLDYSRPGGPVLAHGYRLSFSVVTLVCQILRDPYGGKFERPREYRDAWTRVRPISKGLWPPAMRFAASAIEDVAGGRIFSGPQ